MRRYEPKPWDIRRCDMVHADDGEYVRYDDAHAKIERLKRECEGLRHIAKGNRLAADAEAQFREKAEAERDEARAQVAARDDIIGSWLSAALEDPNAGPEFKADVQRWFETGHHEALEAYGREKVREGMKRAAYAIENRCYDDPALAGHGFIALIHDAILAAMEKEGGE